MSGGNRIVRNRLLPGTIRNAAAIAGYAELWEGVDVSSVVSVEDLPLLPIIDKRMFSVDPGRFLRDDPGTDEPYLVTHTSGTTGAPVERHRGAEELAVVAAFLQSIGARVSPTSSNTHIMTSDYGARGHGGAVAIPTTARVTVWGVHDEETAAIFLEMLLARRGVTANEPVTTVDLHANELKLVTELLARRDRAERDALGGMHLRSAGTYLSEPAAARIRDVWQTDRVDSVYSLSEVFGVAPTCADCGLHHFLPVVIPEVVDFASEGDVAEGEGVLVLTELAPFSLAQPLIRYWTGDLVRVEPARCGADTLGFSYLGRVFDRRGAPARGVAILPSEDVLEACCTAAVDGVPTVLVRAAPLADVLDAMLGLEREPTRLERPALFPELWPARRRVELHSEKGRVRVRVAVFADSPQAVDDAEGRIIEQNPPLARLVASGKADLRVVVES